MNTPELGFLHRFEPGSSPRTLLLLHGTGGDETDLLPLGRTLDPAAALLSPRGNVLENGLPRFFRRLAEGVFDEADVLRRAGELAAFVRAATAHYERDPQQLIAVGYSNGANIAAAVLLLHPGVLASAILLRTMIPLVPPQLPNLAGTPVLIVNGASDPIVPVTNVSELARMLEEAGASVDLQLENAGHQLTSGAVIAAKHWLAAGAGDPG